MDPIISLQDVTFTYENAQHPALSEITFQICHEPKWLRASNGL